MIANDFIQIKKVIEHVYERVLGNTDSNSTSGGNDTKPANNSVESSSYPAEDKVELLCNEQVSLLIYQSTRETLFWFIGDICSFSSNFYHIF